MDSLLHSGRCKRRPEPLTLAKSCRGQALLREIRLKPMQVLGEIAPLGHQPDCSVNGNPLTKGTAIVNGNYKILVVKCLECPVSAGHT